MSYVTYTTEALVCGVFDRNTADRTYLLYTRDAGMLYAEAKSVREERSRQRYALQELTHLKVSLVRGRHAWKIGSVEVVRNDYAAARTRAARGSVTLIYKLLRRYIQGEDPSPGLFDFCVRALTVLANDVKDRTFAEQYVQVCIFSQLGYVAQDSLPAWFSGTAAGLREAPANEADREQLAKLIERAIAHSQL